MNSLRTYGVAALARSMEGMTPEEHRSTTDFLSDDER
jgi:hypothetical protein